MKNSLLILGLLFVFVTVHAQRFTLDKHLFEDTLFLNYNSYGEINITSNTEDSMSLKARVYRNTVDYYAYDTLTIETSFAYLHYGYCCCHYAAIRSEDICGMTKKSNRTSKVDLIIEIKDSTRSMELCLEFFDVLDSNYRDSACFKYYAKKASTTFVSLNDNVDETKVFPNPAKSSLTITNTFNIRSIQIIELSGKVILIRDNLQTPNTTIDLTTLERGLFILTLEDKNGIIVNKKLIIQ